MEGFGGGEGGGLLLVVLGEDTWNSVRHSNIHGNRVVSTDGDLSTGAVLERKEA